ncbi:MAG: response regulator [Sumerlaeia bacterium]
MTEAKPKILAVDDENDVLLILKTALKDEYDVRTASNGPDALASAEEEVPDLVILDMMMPQMDGFEVMAELKARDATNHVPVIFLTGISDKSKIRRALDMGTQYYIVKPFDYNDLLTKVQMALKDAQAAS